MVGQPLAELYTAAGRSVSAAPATPVGPGSLSSARAGRRFPTAACLQGPGQLPERALQAKTHSHHHRLQQTLDHAPAVRHRRQAPPSCSTTPGATAAIRGAGRPPVLQSDEFPAKFLGVYRTAETYRGSTVTPCVLDGLSPGKNSNARSAPSWCTGRITPAPGICRSLTSWAQLGMPGLPGEQSRRSSTPSREGASSMPMAGDPPA